MTFWESSGAGQQRSCHLRLGVYVARVVGFALEGLSMWGLQFEQHANKRA